MITLYLLHDFKGSIGEKIAATTATVFIDLAIIVPCVLGIMGII